MLVFGRISGREGRLGGIHVVAHSAHRRPLLTDEEIAMNEELHAAAQEGVIALLNAGAD